jgi:hypothetical protein
MQKYKDVESDIIKLKLFPFSLRGKAKDWLLSLPKNSIDSWANCKYAFIGRWGPRITHPEFPLCIQLTIP